MAYQHSLLIFALIPIVLLVSCSTRHPIPKTAGPSQAAPLSSFEQTQPLARLKSEPAYPESFDSGLFPKPQALEHQINFWRAVYAEWSRSQIAVHDNLYLNVVYEVPQLPGVVGESLTAEQKEFVRERLDYWKYQLASLEAKMDARAPLNGEEQRLAQLLANSADGVGAIRGATDRIRFQRGTRERFKRGLEISGMYDRTFREIFRRAGLPEDLAYLPHVESSFQAKARSSAGALGMWQFTAGAARMFMNGDDSVSARLDPITSAQGAARYLLYAYDKLGSWPLAVTSYNHGIGGMQRARKLYGQDFSRIVKDYDHPLFGFASRNYYAEFLAAREIANNAERYFPEGVRYQPHADWMLARLSAEGDGVNGSRPVVSREAGLRPSAANVVAARVAPMTGRKVSLHSRPKTTGTYKKAVSAPRLSINRRHQIGPSVRQAPGVGRAAVTPAARQAAAGVRSAAVNPRASTARSTVAGRSGSATVRTVSDVVRQTSVGLRPTSSAQKVATRR